MSAVCDQTLWKPTPKIQEPSSREDPVGSMQQPVRASFLRSVIFAGAPAKGREREREREWVRESRRGWPVQKYARISPGRYANGILAVLLSQSHHTLTYLMRRARTYTRLRRRGGCCTCRSAPRRYAHTRACTHTAAHAQTMHSTSHWPAYKTLIRPR